MTIEKGAPWGGPGSLPDDGVVVRTDAEGRAVVTRARRQSTDIPALGVVGGDLYRTLGGRGDERRLRSPDAVTFPVDLGEVLMDGRLHFFVAHLVARNRWWTDAFVAMNAQFRGGWNLGPRAHPNDGLLDTYEAHLRVADLPKVRARLNAGTHVPHPRIRERRVAALQVEFRRPLAVELDGEAVGTARILSIRCHPDALTVVL